MCITGVVCSITGKGKYCDDCKVERRKAQSKARGDNKKASQANSRKRAEDLTKNFTDLKLSGEDLFPKNFNQISQISASSYMKRFKKNWIEVMEMYGKKEEFLECLSNSYYQRFLKTGNKSLGEFAREIGLMYRFLTEELKESLWDRVQMNNRYIKDNNELQENFNKLVNKLGKIPHYNEFMEHSPIKIGTYARRLGLAGNGKVYDRLVRLYTSEEEYATYKEEQQEIKSKTGRENHQGEKYTDEELEREFKRVFDEIISKTLTTPPRRVFNKLSKFDDSIYRNRLNMSFGEVAEYYGYDFDTYQNKSEKLVIETIGRLIGESPVPQALFDWLRSVKNGYLRCDGYYPNNKIVVEFDGKQHYQPVNFGGVSEEEVQENFKLTQKNDEIKNTLIPQHGIKLIRISCYDPYWDKDFLKFRLLEHGIKIPDSKVIYFN